MKRWKPEVGEEYWNINTFIEVNSFIWTGFGTDIGLYKIGNCFRTKKEAIAAAKKIREVFRDVRN